MSQKWPFCLRDGLVFFFKVAQREFVSLCPSLRRACFQLKQPHPWLPSPLISSIHPRKAKTDNIFFFASLKLTEVGGHLTILVIAVSRPLPGAGQGPNALTLILLCVLLVSPERQALSQCCR